MVLTDTDTELGANTATDTGNGAGAGAEECSVIWLRLQLGRVCPVSVFTAVPVPVHHRDDPSNYFGLRIFIEHVCVRDQAKAFSILTDVQFH